MAESIGIAPPSWLREISDWLGENGPLVFPVVFTLSFILLLQSTHKRSDLLYRPATVLLAMLLCQIAGDLWPILWLFALLAGMSLIASMSAKLVERSRRESEDDSLDYFGSRYPSRVFLNGVMALLPPFMLALTVVNAIRDAYTLPERDRIWPEFAQRLRNLQAADPRAADALRAEALLQLSSDGGRGFDRRMIAHFLTSPDPTGAAIVDPGRA